MIPAWHAHPSVWAVLGSVWIGYLVAVRTAGRRRVGPEERPASRRQMMLFSLGMLTLLVGAAWPVHDLAERALYSVHMLQHMLFTLVAPPLLLLGMPAWMLRALLRPVMPLARVVLRPVAAFIVFNAVLVASHWPAVVTYTVLHEWAHFLAHVVLVSSGLIMWWPVLSPLAELPRLGSPQRMLYLFLQSILPTVPASFLTFGSQPLYPIYATFPRVWHLSALTDQRIAGLVMKLGGGFYLWGWIAGIFFRWYGDEEQGRPDTAEFQALERELNRTTKVAS